MITCQRKDYLFYTPVHTGPLAGKAIPGQRFKGRTIRKVMGGGQK
jgi:hypothetical protein